ncbi:MAG: hypothetical protein ACXABY_09710 [Candidatus Thorarchaeota archaeon]|jgi:hypothetical protein
MATYTKTNTLDLTDGGDTVYTAINNTDGNVDQIITDLNACHLTTRGDVLIRGASAATRLAIGTASQIIKSDGTDPAWAHKFATVAKSAGYTTTLADEVILVNTDAGRAIVLGTAATVNGKVQIIKDSDGTGAGTNNITVSTEASETIDGGATYVMNADRESITVVSNGTNWFIVSSYKE